MKRALWVVEELCKGEWLPLDECAFNYRDSAEAQMADEEVERGRGRKYRIVKYGPVK